MIKRVFKYVGIVITAIVVVLGVNIWKDIKKNNQLNALVKEIAELKALEVNKDLPRTIENIYIYSAKSEGSQLIYRYKLLDVEEGNYDKQVLRSAMMEEFCHDENEGFFNIGGSVLFYVEDKNSSLLAKEIINGHACEMYSINNIAITDAEQDILQ